MRFRIVDVETVSHPDADRWLEPVEPDADLLEPIEPNHRLRDPKKVMADTARVERLRAERPQLIYDNIAAKTAKRFEKCSLDPDCNRIVCLGYKDTDGGDPIVQVCRNEESEAYNLETFWATYRKTETKLVTFYGLGFDLPVLMRRSLYLGVKYPPLSVDRYRTPHIDICQKLSFNGVMKPHSLKFYCRRFGIQTNDPFDGAQIAELVATGRWDDVRDHCMADVGATHQLAIKLGLLEAA